MTQKLFFTSEISNDLNNIARHRINAGENFNGKNYASLTIREALQGLVDAEQGQDYFTPDNFRRPQQKQMAQLLQSILSEENCLVSQQEISSLASFIRNAPRYGIQNPNPDIRRGFAPAAI